MGKLAKLANLELSIHNGLLAFDLCLLIFPSSFPELCQRFWEMRFPFEMAFA